MNNGEKMRLDLDFILNYFNQNVLISVINDFLIALIILLTGIIIGKIIGKTIYVALNKLQLDDLANFAGINLSLEKTFSNFISYIIDFIFIVLAISQLGITTTIINYIVIVVLIIIGISILFVIKYALTNFSSFYVISKNKMFEIGDQIEIKNVEGKIQKITLTETIIKTKNEDLIYIPNNIVVNEIVKKKKS